MSKPFDATLRVLFEADPLAWLACAGLVADGPARILDTDLSSITSEADAAVLIAGPVPWIVHFEFQTSADPTLPRRLLRYNDLLSYREGYPVRTVVILLRPKADGPGMGGVFRQSLPDGSPVFEFHYRVVRVWQIAVDDLLSGNIASLPLAPIADVPKTSIPDVIRRMQTRISAEAAPELAGKLWTATSILMGLGFEKSFTDALLRGVRAMEDSVTYQAIVAKGRTIGLMEGRALEARRILSRFGERRFGLPDAPTADAIEAISDANRLERMIDRVLDAVDWDDLLSTP